MILFPGFIDPERCQHLVKTAQARLAPSGLALRKTEGPQETECAPHTSTPGPIDRTWPCLTAVLRLTSSECGLLMGIWEVAAAEHPCIRRPATLKPDPALAEGTP